MSKNALTFFNVTPKSIKRQKNAALSNVFLINNEIILRSRVADCNTRTRFLIECNLLTCLANTTGFAVPIHITGRNGENFFVENNLFWTAYKLIPGDVFCTWYNINQLPPHHVSTCFKVLENIHRKTKGNVCHKLLHSYFDIAETCSRLALKYQLLFSRTMISTVLHSVDVIKHHQSSLLPTERCIIHGDFHPGNIVFNGDLVSGLIDTDFVRPGHYLEDLAFSTMMFLRDFTKPYIYVESEIGFYYDLYKAPRTDYDLFKHYLLLFCFFDIETFEGMANQTNNRDLLDYQIRMFRRIADAQTAIS